jgi:integrase
VFLLSSGATTGEAAAVQAEDSNWPTPEVWIHGTKTAYRQRRVQLPRRAIKIMGLLPVSGPVFLTPTGRSITTGGKHGNHLIRQFHKLCKDAKPPDERGIVLYTLRHTSCTWFGAQVGDHDRLIDRGGWRDGRMARHYPKRPPRGLADRRLDHGWDFRP